MDEEQFKDKIKDKLDLYAGGSMGVGLGIFMGAHSNDFVDRNRNRLFANLHVGPHVGIRYWAGKKVAIFGEFGWGATFANLGVTF